MFLNRLLQTNPIFKLAKSIVKKKEKNIEENTTTIQFLHTGNKSY